MEPQHNIIDALQPLATPIGDLHQDPANARTGHDVERIAASLAQYGQRKPLVVNRSEHNKIEAGNGTWQAAKSLGWTHVAAVMVEDDAMTAVGFALADNRTAELSRWDLETLQTLMESMDPDYETGFAEGELEALLEAAGLGEDEAYESIGENADADPRLDRAVELMNEWGTQPGQLWKLPSRTAGQFHLLLCGDATDIPTVERLMAGQRAPLFATDPPYLVDYDGTNHPGKGKKETEAKNKDWSGTYKDWDNSAQGDGLYDGFVSAAIAAAITENAAWYCWHASRRQAMVEAVWERHGAFVHQQIIWVKDRPILTRSWYMWQHEPCFFGWVRGKKPVRAADDSPRGVWQIPTTSFGDKPDHPTPKPLEVWQIPMLQHTRPGELCYEPFCGSGSQIIAAENLGRQCRAIEIAPPYVAVALQRYLDAFEIRGELVE